MREVAVTVGGCLVIEGVTIRNLDSFPTRKKPQELSSLELRYQGSIALAAVRREASYINP